MATAAQAKRALELFESELLGRKNVIGLGIVPASDTPGASAEMAVAVYVKQKLPLGKLRAAEVVPKELRSGKVCVPTRVIDSGGEFQPERL